MERYIRFLTWFTHKWNQVFTLIDSIQLRTWARLVRHIEALRYEQAYKKAYKKHEKTMKNLEDNDTWDECK